MCKESAFATTLWFATRRESRKKKTHLTPLLSYELIFLAVIFFRH